jgi:hypothetical protein
MRSLCVQRLDIGERGALEKNSALVRSWVEHASLTIASSLGCDTLTLNVWDRARVGTPWTLPRSCQALPLSRLHTSELARHRQQAPQAIDLRPGDRHCRAQSKQ